MRILGFMIAVSFAVSGCVPDHLTPVQACRPRADGTRPSTGTLEVLPSEIDGATLDSMQWQSHTGHEGQEFGTCTSLSASGQIVSTREVSLVGAAVRFEFVNGSTVVRTLTDSSFWRARQIAPPVGTTDALETVRPNRHVRTLVSLLELGDKPSVVWDVPRVRASSEPLRENGSRERRCSCRRKNERRVSIPPIGGISNSIRS